MILQFDSPYTFILNIYKKTPQNGKKPSCKFHPRVFTHKNKEKLWCTSCISHIFHMKMHPKPCETSKMEHFAKIVNTFKWLAIFVKRSILDIWRGFEYGYYAYNDNRS